MIIAITIAIAIATKNKKQKTKTKTKTDNAGNFTPVNSSVKVVGAIHKNNADPLKVGSSDFQLDACKENSCSNNNNSCECETLAGPGRGFKKAAVVLSSE